MVYLPPPADLLTFETLHTELFLNYNNIIAVGDFNLNQFDSNKSYQLRLFCTRNNLSICHNCKPTHFDITHSSTSLLDLFLVSDSGIVNFSSQVQCPSISHHALIFATFKMNIEVIDRVIVYRDFGSIDWNSLHNYLSCFDFSRIFNSVDIDEKVSTFSSLMEVLYSFVPIRTKRVQSTDDRWIKSREVVLARSLRDLAMKDYDADPSEQRWKTFCKLRNRAKNVMRRVRRKYFANLFWGLDNCGLWRVLKRSGCVPTEGFVYDEDVDTLNLYFVGGLDNGEWEGIDLDDFNNSVDLFSFHCIDENELLEAFNKVKSKSIGVDGIPISFLKTIYPLISDVILNLVNCILTTSSFPTSWKLARVVPIPKSNTVRGVDDLRPISILPAISKVVEHLVKNQILSHVERNIFQSQFAFRSGYSTTSLLLALTDDIRRSENDNCLSLLVSLDLTKAFNSICYTNLLIKLRDQFGFSKSACKLIMSFISERKQFVDLNGSFSSNLRLSSGVPQGSVLGPLLFILYINDLPSVLNDMCKTFIFADDILLLFRTERVFSDLLECNVNFCLSNIFQWTMSNSLVVNPVKTKAMLFGSSNRYISNLNLHINNYQIELVNHHKCLGIVIDEQLNFELHIAFVQRKVSFILRRLHSANIFLPLWIKLRIAKALLMPQVLYGLEIISGTTSNYLSKLRRVVNSIVRFVYNIRVWDHVSEHVANFLGCPFNEFVKFRNLFFFYRTFKSRTVMQLYNTFIFSRSTRHKQILIPRIRCSFFGRSFGIRIARWWNCLPHELRIFSQSNNAFRLKLFNHFVGSYL